MANDPRIFTFMIISFNRPKETVEVVQNILELENVEGFSKEIMVINNGSDKSYKEFEDYLDSLDEVSRAMVVYIDHHENTGVAGGRNLGISKASGEYIFSIDDDAEFEQLDVLPFTLKKFEEYKDDNVKLIGFTVKNYYDGSLDLPVKDKSKAQEKEFLNNLFWGGAHVIKKDVFDKVGVYSEEFFYGMEEYDLAYKTMDAGYRILFTSSINVLHKVSPEGREPERTKFRRMLENKVLVAYKYLPKRYVISHLLMWSIFYLVKSKGHITGFLKIFTSLRSRSKTTDRNPISRDTLRYIKSVKGRVWY